jgi:hypothetical protein
MIPSDRPTSRYPSTAEEAPPPPKAGYSLRNRRVSTTRGNCSLEIRTPARPVARPCEASVWKAAHHALDQLREFLADRRVRTNLGKGEKVRFSEETTYTLQKNSEGYYRVDATIPSRIFRPLQSLMPAHFKRSQVGITYTPRNGTLSYGKGSLSKYRSKELDKIERIILENLSRRSGVKPPSEIESDSSSHESMPLATPSISLSDYWNSIPCYGLNEPA